MLSHNSWFTVGFSGYTYTFRLSSMTGALLAETTSGILWVSLAIPIHSGCQAWQEHYLMSHNFWYTVGFSGYTNTFRLSRDMTGALPAESQLLVYWCGYTYTFRLSEAWQEHYLLSRNFWCTVVAIPIHSGCQAWQKHYLLSHNFWCTVMAIHIHSAVRGMTGALPPESQLLVYCCFLYIQAVKHDRSITCWDNFWYTVGFSGYTYTFRLSGMTGALPNESQLLVYCWFLWLYLYIQAVRGMAEALPAVSQQLVYCCGYTYTFRLSGMTGALPAESQLLVYYCGFTYTFRLSAAWQEHYLLSHNFWCTVGFSGYTYTFRLS